jgi:predicted signal transduction protein with EAL and GGDEF domain
VAGVDIIAVSAAAGFTMLRPADDPQQILDRADRAMYARKRALRGN